MKFSVSTWSTLSYKKMGKFNALHEVGVKFYLTERNIYSPDMILNIHKHTFEENLHQSPPNSNKYVEMEYIIKGVSKSNCVQ